MIQILPATRERETEILKDMAIGEDSAVVLEMMDGKSPMGQAVIRLEKNSLVILGLNVTGYDGLSNPDEGQSFVLDSLMRASASYGETKGATKIIIAFDDVFGFFQKRGFTKKDTFCEGPMSLIVKYKRNSLVK